MNLTRIYFQILVLVNIFLIAGCASVPMKDIQEFKSSEFSKSTSKEAFSNVEPKLLQLKPGDSIDASGLIWNVNEIVAGQRVVGVNAISDGWIRPLSGGISGAVTQFGAPYGKSGKKLDGIHIFGYVWGNVNVVPKYALLTQADIISRDEFNDLRNKKVSGIAPIHGEENSQIFIKNIVVKKLTKLNYPDPPTSPGQIGNKITELSYKEKYLSKNAYFEIENDLKNLKAGMSMMDFISNSKGHIISTSSGDDFIIYGIKGFLNSESGYRWGKMASNGAFSVWSFGYYEGNNIVPKISLIFKNGEVFKTVSYNTREEIEKLFSE